ncbi:hypothetical protein PGT21_036410 [Puccinia graminis f. sp. tritici]|uniref:Uncharacterized protein n=1 Tax=Puccinia graminis f. sp. tritici TaxID=56615 RepID=A0A5B0PD41_PUCGR|nr:hypothetical protein PGT21_036410 [Puccinia graminis f. sp. tritici]
MEKTDNPLLIGNLFGIQGRIAVITGGGTGLGKMMANAWVVNGGHVVIAARKEEVLSKTCERLNGMGTGKAEYITSDLSSKAGCAALCDELKKRFDKIHVLVNNSGMAIAGEFHQYPEKDWDDVFNLNVKSIFYMTSELTPLLAKDATNLDPGRVIVIASVQAFNNHSVFGDRGIWSYSSSKAAAVSLASNLAVTLGPKFITVNAICPGLFPSSMTEEIISHAEQLACSLHPMGRYGAVEDMAGVFLFLASRAGAHISANAILSDGGATAAGKVPHDVVSPQASA